MSTAAEDQESYSTDEVCGLVGITYRMIDYWLRRGIISIANPANGSGSHRRFTRDEVDVLIQVVAHYHEIHERLGQFADGTLWSLMLAEREMTKGTNDDRRTGRTARQRHPSARRPGGAGVRTLRSARSGRATADEPAG